MTPRPYASPLRFKDALEQRLRNAATDGVAFARARQMLVFDRFLARVAASFGDAAVLKGGLVLELRLARARTTRDIDLRRQFGWFLRMSESQILDSDLTITHLFKAALSK